VSALPSFRWLEPVERAEDPETDAIILRTIALRRLQRELRGELAEEGYIVPPEIPASEVSYRHGQRRWNPGQCSPRAPVNARYVPR
jgi:hypothetical protein